MELSPSDQRIKQIMEQCGHPNSMSLYQAFKQFEMEIRIECGRGQQTGTVDSLALYDKDADDMDIRLGD